MRKTRKPNNPKKKSSPDKLLKASKKGEAELTEDELKRVSGGSIYLKYGSTSGSTTTTGFKDWIGS
jgi:bacteriocin-like protein